MFRKWFALSMICAMIATSTGCALRERRGGLLARYRGQSPTATFVPYSQPMSPATPCEYTIPGPIWDTPCQPGCGPSAPPMPGAGTPPPSATEQPGTAPRVPAGPSKLIRPGQTASDPK
jgi:hypothetical protein